MEYKSNLAKESKQLGININITNFNLKLNIHDLSIGHIRLLLQNGIYPLNIRIRDDYKKILCDISIKEMISLFDQKFSILNLCSSSMLDDIYPLFIIHFEAKKDLIRILSLCQLCNMQNSTILRNYFGLISDFIYGESSINDDIYCDDLRTRYIQNHLIAAKNKSGVKNPDFFIYFLSKYVITDTKFLSYFASKAQLELLKKFCSQQTELKPLLYQFNTYNDSDSANYNSYYSVY